MFAHIFPYVISYLKSTLLSDQNTNTRSPLADTDAWHSHSHEFNFYFETRHFEFHAGIVRCHIYYDTTIIPSHTQFHTRYRPHRALILKVCIQYIEISTRCGKCLQECNCTDQNASCLRFIHISSQTLLRVVCLMSLSLI